MKSRLRDTFGLEPSKDYDVVGEPTTEQDAKRLAADDPYQFQWWALGLVGARPTEEKKGADKGIDGRLYFTVDPKEPAKQLIISVNAGKLHATYVRDLVGVIGPEKAEIGVLISFNEPTGPMRSEAASAGFFDSPGGSHQRIQLLTVGELLDGRRIDMPPMQANVTVKRAPPGEERAGREAERDGAGMTGADDEKSATTRASEFARLMRKQRPSSGLPLIVPDSGEKQAVDRLVRETERQGEDSQRLASESLLVAQRLHRLTVVLAIGLGCQILLGVWAVAIGVFTLIVQVLGVGSR